MAMSRDKVVERLQTAQRKQFPVRVRRRKLVDHPMYGYIVGVAKRWVVVQELQDAVYVDGYHVLRIKDITSVKNDRDAEYVERAVSQLGRPTPGFTIPHDARTRDVLEAAARHAPLIGVHGEQYEGEPLLIGKLGRLGKKKLDLLFIDPRGRWEDSPRRWRYAEVTRVEIESRYISALERFGDPVPPSVIRA
ncbi:hypothetical protein [Aeromicrobium sp. 9AM]|uniref:hypothetical protein n=1 Tax=Aeromicrobium sp. 9AM TaxID=2653126 RepID=UPI0012F0A8A1|nr:hypothetical protein [Aeromicrobium sp. 9AM]VXC04150.1 conserved hypothetical protein [Aeromicrobium sp. 9AM]